MSHGYWFMQRCFASCIGYEVSNESQYGTDQRGRNFVVAVKATGATALGGGGGFQEAAKWAEKMDILREEKLTLCTQYIFNYRPE